MCLAKWIAGFTVLILKDLVISLLERLCLIRLNGTLLTRIGGVSNFVENVSSESGSVSCSLLLALNHYFIFALSLRVVKLFKDFLYLFI